MPANHPQMVPGGTGGGAVGWLEMKDATFSHTVTTPDDASANFGFNGTTADGGPSGIAAWEWLTGTAPASDYEVVVTIISGSFSSGAAGVFQLGGVLNWTASWTSDSAGSKSVTARYDIRKVGTTTILATGTITLRIWGRPLMLLPSRSISNDASAPNPAFDSLISCSLLDCP